MERNAHHPPRLIITVYEKLHCICQLENRDITLLQVMNIYII